MMCVLNKPHQTYVPKHGKMGGVKIEKNTPPQNTKMHPVEKAKNVDIAGHARPPGKTRPLSGGRC